MSNLRKATETDFPYGWPKRVCYLEIAPTGLNQVRGRDEMRKAVTRACAGESKLIATWPGEWSTDAFIIDNPKLLAEAIGLRV